MTMDKIIYALIALQASSFIYYKIKFNKLNRINEKLKAESLKKDQLIRDQSYVISQDNKTRKTQSDVNRMSDDDIERMFIENKWSE